MKNKSFCAKNTISTSLLTTQDIDSCVYE